MAVPDEMASNPSLDDFESGLRPLWLRGQKGDEAAYADALTRLASRLRPFFARRLFALPDDVEDLVQETLLALHLQRGTYDPDLPVSAWAFAIARHKLVDLLRRHGRRESRHLSLDDLPEDQQPLAATGLSARRDLAQLMQALPTAQRLAIVMTKLEGLSMAEASSRSGVSVTALKVQVHRGLRRLAQRVRGDR